MKNLSVMIITLALCYGLASLSFAQPANDDCANAIAIGEVTNYSFSTIDATHDGMGMACLSFMSNNIWYLYTPTISGMVQIKLDSTDYLAKVAVYNGDTCDPLPLQLACTSTMTGFEVFQGNSYLIEIGDEWGYYTGNGQLTIGEAPPPPANDLCTDAIAIGEVTGLTFSTLWATGDGLGSCMSSHDIWYEYTPSFTGNALINFDGSMYGIMVAVYNGNSCLALPDELLCSSDFRSVFPVVSGNHYLIQIGGNYDDAGDGIFSISEAPPTPDNDNCEAADDGGILYPDVPMQFTGDNTSATNDCSGVGYPEVWVKFTTEVCMNITIDYCGTNPPYTWTMPTYLYDACPCETGNTYYSSSGGGCPLEMNSSGTWNNIQPGTYYFPIIGQGIEGPYIVNVNGEECPPPPEVDEYITAPDTVTGNTCGEINNCQQLSGEDYIYEVTIPENGIWVFSLCGSEAIWESQLKLGTSLCGSELGSNDHGCGQYPGHAALTVYDLAAGTYYLTIDSWSECGEYTLDITRLPGPCEGSYYSNGTPDYEDDIRSYRDSENDIFGADDFTLTEDVLITSIKFYGADSGEFDFDNLGDYKILANDGSNGAPGTVVFEATDIPCSQVELDLSYGDGNDVNLYEISGLNITLSAGTYFLACRPVGDEESSSSNKWLTTGAQTGSMAYYQENAGAWILSDIDADLAFCIFATTEGGSYAYLPGDANMSAGGWPPMTIGGDVTYLVSYFRGITAPCMLDGFYAAADANGSCSVTGADVTKLVSYFRGMDDLSYCPDYPTTWPPIPDTAPDGWPNCASPVLSK